MTVPGLQLTAPTAELAEQFLTWRHRPDVTRWFLQQRIEDTDGSEAGQQRVEDASRALAGSVGWPVTRGRPLVGPTARIAA